MSTSEEAERLLRAIESNSVSVDLAAESKAVSEMRALLTRGSIASDFGALRKSAYRVWNSAAVLMRNCEDPDNVEAHGTVAKIRHLASDLMSLAAGGKAASAVDLLTVVRFWTRTGRTWLVAQSAEMAESAYGSATEAWEQLARADGRPSEGPEGAAGRPEQAAALFELLLDRAELAWSGGAAQRGACWELVARARGLLGELPGQAEELARLCFGFGLEGYQRREFADAARWLKLAFEARPRPRPRPGCEAGPEAGQAAVEAALAIEESAAGRYLLCKAALARGEPEEAERALAALADDPAVDANSRAPSRPAPARVAGGDVRGRRRALLAIELFVAGKAFAAAGAAYERLLARLEGAQAGAAGEVIDAATRDLLRAGPAAGPPPSAPPPRRPRPRPAPPRGRRAVRGEAAQAVGSLYVLAWNQACALFQRRDFRPALDWFRRALLLLQERREGERDAGALGKCQRLLGYCMLAIKQPEEAGRMARRAEQTEPAVALEAGDEAGACEQLARLAAAPDFEAPSSPSPPRTPTPRGGAGRRRRWGGGGGAGAWARAARYLQAAAARLRADGPARLLASPGPAPPLPSPNRRTAKYDCGPGRREELEWLCGAGWHAGRRRRRPAPRAPPPTSSTPSWRRASPRRAASALLDCARAALAAPDKEGPAAAARPKQADADLRAALALAARARAAAAAVPTPRAGRGGGGGAGEGAGAEAWEEVQAAEFEGRLLLGDAGLPAALPSLAAAVPRRAAPPSGSASPPSPPTPASGGRRGGAGGGGAALRGALALRQAERPADLPRVAGLLRRQAEAGALAEAERGRVPAEEVEWMAAGAWQEGALAQKTARLDAAERWMALSLRLVRHSPALAASHLPPPQPTQPAPRTAGAPGAQGRRRSAGRRRGGGAGGPGRGGAAAAPLGGGGARAARPRGAGGVPQPAPAAPAHAL
eukprot:tig00020537_g10224.t1